MLWCVYSTKLICVKFNYSMPFVQCSIGLYHSFISFFFFLNFYFFYQNPAISYDNLLMRTIIMILILLKRFLCFSGFWNSGKANILVFRNRMRDTYKSWTTQKTNLLNRKLKKFLIWHFWCALMRAISILFIFIFICLHFACIQISSEIHFSDLLVLHKQHFTSTTALWICHSWKSTFQKQIIEMLICKIESQIHSFFCIQTIEFVSWFIVLRIISNAKWKKILL